MRLEAEPWWRQAEADRQAARDTFAAGHYFVVSWLAHQATEKALKALLIDRSGAQTPRTHDLRFLGRRVRAPSAVLTDLTSLDPAFDEVRYPDPITNLAPVDLIDPDTASQDLGTAERAMAWIEQQLKP